ncbi:DNA repair protein, putative [Babesia caballi]|uniref:DNA repair protein, putative n=1 Tax=Babesia caballi TaxID=5871 RepID=A0AAV4LR28_BABCB|nr:DNA repair protein, putative [Babesia caballi]
MRRRINDDEVGTVEGGIDAGAETHPGLYAPPGRDARGREGDAVPTSALPDDAAAKNIETDVRAVGRPESDHYEVRQGGLLRSVHKRSRLSSVEGAVQRLAEGKRVQKRVDLRKGNVNRSYAATNVAAEKSDVGQHVLSSLASLESLNVVLQPAPTLVVIQARKGHLEVNERGKLGEHEVESALAQMVAVSTLLGRQLRLVLAKSFQSLATCRLLRVVRNVLEAQRPVGKLSLRRESRSGGGTDDIRGSLAEGVVRGRLLLVGVEVLGGQRPVRLDGLDDGEVVAGGGGVGRFSGQGGLVGRGGRAAGGLLRVAEGDGELASALEAVLADGKYLLDALALLVGLADPAHAADRRVEPDAADLRVELAAPDVGLAQRVGHGSTGAEDLVVLAEALGHGLGEVLLAVGVGTLHGVPLAGVVGDAEGRLAAGERVRAAMDAALALRRALGGIEVELGLAVAGQRRPLAVLLVSGDQLGLDAAQLRLGRDDHRLRELLALLGAARGVHGGGVVDSDRHRDWLLVRVAAEVHAVLRPHLLHVHIDQRAVRERRKVVLVRGGGAHLDCQGHGHLQVGFAAGAFRGPLRRDPLLGALQRHLLLLHDPQLLLQLLARPHVERQRLVPHGGAEVICRRRRSGRHGHALLAVDLLPRHFVVHRVVGLELVGRAREGQLLRGGWLFLHHPHAHQTGAGETLALRSAVSHSAAELNVSFTHCGR